MFKASNNGMYRYSSDKLSRDHAHCLSGFGYTLDNFCHLCFATMLLSLVALSFHCPSPPINICLPTLIYLHTSLYVAQCRSRLVYMRTKPRITVGAYCFIVLVFFFCWSLKFMMESKIYTFFKHVVFCSIPIDKIQVHHFVFCV